MFQNKYSCSLQWDDAKLTVWCGCLSLSAYRPQVFRCAGNPPDSFQVVLCVQGEGRDCGQAFGSAPAQVSTLHSAPPPRSPAPLLLIVRPSLLFHRQLVRHPAGLRGGGGGRRSAGVGGPWRHVSADAQSATQRQAPQVVEAGTADLTVRVQGSMAAAARQLEPLELIEEEGGVGRVLQGGEGGLSPGRTCSIYHITTSLEQIVQNEKTFVWNLCLMFFLQTKVHQTCLLF